MGGGAEGCSEHVSVWGGKCFSDVGFWSFTHVLGACVSDRWTLVRLSKWACASQPCAVAHCKHGYKKKKKSPRFSARRASYEAIKGVTNYACVVCSVYVAVVICRWVNFTFANVGDGEMLHITRRVKHFRTHEANETIETWHYYKQSIAWHLCFIWINWQCWCLAIRMVTMVCCLYVYLSGISCIKWFFF